MSGVWCPCWAESVGSWGPSHLPAEVSAHRDGWGRGEALVSWNYFLDTWRVTVYHFQPSQCISEHAESLKESWRGHKPAGQLWWSPQQHNAEQRTLTFMWCLGGDTWALGTYVCSHVWPYKILCREEPFRFLLTHVLSITKCLHVNHTSSMLAEFTVAWMRHRDK